MRKKKYASIEGKVLIPLGLFTLILGVSLYCWDFGISLHGVTTTGMAYEKTRKGYIQAGGGIGYEHLVRIAFEDESGKRIMTEDTLPLEEWRHIREGEQVVLVYHPERPKQIEVRNPTLPGLKRQDLGIIWTGLVLLVSGCLLVFKESRTARTA